MILSDIERNVEYQEWQETHEDEGSAGKMEVYVTIEISARELKTYKMGCVGHVQKVIEYAVAQRLNTKGLKEGKES